MISRSISLGMGLFILILVAGVAHSQEPPKKPVIDPKADTVLRQMSDHLKQVKASVFILTDTIDDVQQNGQKLQFAHIRKLTVIRPNRLKVETSGDVTNRTLWKDGKTVTVLDRDKNVYAQIPDPGTIDQTVDLLQDKYGMSLPAADLLAEDAYKVMTDGCDSIKYVGLGYVGEEKCHHLAFTRNNIDWQLWIGAGEKPQPRKMVITYKDLAGEPQYTLQLVKVENADQIGDLAFACTIPKGAKKIGFQPTAMPK